MRKTARKFAEVALSRFEWITISPDGWVYPFDAVGLQSAQHLGTLSTDPRASVTMSEDGYVVKTEE